MIDFHLEYSKADEDWLGFLPYFFDENDPLTAEQQLDKEYAHGGGYRPHPEQDKWTFDSDTKTLVFEDDEPLHLIASAKLHDQNLYFYFSGSWLVIENADKSWSVTRVD